MAQFISDIKAINPALKVAYHSDGWFYPIIEELIEVGVDVLNPIQTQQHGPRRPQEGLRRPALLLGLDRRAAHPARSALRPTWRPRSPSGSKTLGKDGGLILAPSQHVQLDTPVENFLAMVEAVKATPCT